MEPRRLGAKAVGDQVRIRVAYHRGGADDTMQQGTLLPASRCAERQRAHPLHRRGAHWQLRSLPLLPRPSVADVRRAVSGEGTSVAWRHSPAVRAVEHAVAPLLRAIDQRAIDHQLGRQAGRVVQRELHVQYKLLLNTFRRRRTALRRRPEETRSVKPMAHGCLSRVVAGRVVQRKGGRCLESRHLESRPKTEARLDLEVSAG
jgi:hypothetical protein